MRSGRRLGLGLALLGEVEPGRLARQHLARGGGRPVADQQHDGGRREPCGLAGRAGVRRRNGPIGGTDDHRRLCAVASNRAPRDSVAAVQRDVAACRRCPRLVAWREEVARTGRAAYAGQVYWGRGVPGFGDPRAALVMVGLAPAAHGANRTGPDVHRRPLGRLALRRAATGPASRRNRPARRATTA